MLSMNDWNYSIHLYEYFIYNKDLYLVLEYWNGGSLGDYIRDLKKKNKYLEIDEQRIIAFNIS